MKWIIALVMLFIAAIYCESVDIKGYYIDAYTQSCCDQLEPDNECHLEEWSGGDINFYVLIKTGTIVTQMPIDHFIDYCQCSECCD